MNGIQTNIKTHRLILAAALAAILFDLLLYDSVFRLIPFGINLPIAVAAFYAGVFWALGKPLPLRRYPFHVALTLLLSLTFPLYNNPILLTLNALFILLLLGEQIMLTVGHAKQDPWSVCFIGDSLSCWFLGSFGGIKGAFSQYGSNRKGRGLRNLLIGAAITVPVAIIVLCLLLSADITFQNLFQQLFGNVRWWDIIGYSACALFVFTFVSGLLWSAGNPPRKAQPSASAAISGHFPEIGAFMLLGALVLILGVFSVTQFLYLFPCLSSGILPAGVSYSEYARSGFYQLLAVSLIVLLFLFLIVKFSAKTSPRKQLLKQILLTLLCAFTLVLLCSAFLRMLLYEQVYQFTQLRIFTQFFMVALAAVLILRAFALWFPLPLRKLVLISGMACYTVLALMNLDGFIARQNVAFQGKNADLAYLASLSCDALPYYIDLLDEQLISQPDVSPSRNGYYCQTDFDLPDPSSSFIAWRLSVMEATLDRSNGWQYLNAGRAKARALLADHAALSEKIPSADLLK